MTKQLTTIFFIALFFQCRAQVVRHSVIGHIGNDSISVESIHILNKNTNKGTISNKYGMFKIPVKVNDTLVFYGIQFQKKELVITDKILRNKTFDLALLQKINKLQPVEIKNINLTGELLNDAKKVKKPISMVANGALNFSNIDFNVVDNIDTIDRMTPPDPFTGTSAKVQVGGNVLGLLGYVLDPLFNELGKIGAHKRKKKRFKNAYKKRALTVPNKIRTELGDAFFINQLKISKNKIDAFISYCKSKGIVNLYMTNKKIEMIQVFIKEAKEFNKKAED